jgi:hypothetical protein
MPTLLMMPPPPVLRRYAYPDALDWTHSGLYHEFRNDPTGYFLTKLPAFAVALCFDTAYRTTCELEPTLPCKHGVPLAWPLGNVGLVGGGSARVIALFLAPLGNVQGPGELIGELCSGFVADADMQALHSEGMLPHVAPTWALDAIADGALSSLLPQDFVTFLMKLAHLQSLHGHR